MIPINHHHGCCGSSIEINFHNCNRSQSKLLADRAKSWHTKRNISELLLIESSSSSLSVNNHHHRNHSKNLYCMMIVVCMVILTVLSPICVNGQYTLHSVSTILTLSGEQDCSIYVLEKFTFSFR